MLLTPRSSPVILVNCHIPPLLNVTEFLGLPTSKPFLIGTFAFQRFCTCLHTLAQFNFIALSVIVCSSFHATVLTCIVLVLYFWNSQSFAGWTIFTALLPLLCPFHKHQKLQQDIPMAYGVPLPCTTQRTVFPSFEFLSLDSFIMTLLSYWTA